LRIAATLAGAVLVGLLMLPAAAQATPTSPQPPPARELQLEPEQATIAGGFELARQEGEAAPQLLRKRKKPQFQTRFFAE
jgi:hypothetical protein